MQLVAATSPNSVAASIFLATPAWRIVVGHCTPTPSGVYRLVVDSQDLLRYLAFTAKAIVTMSTLPLDVSPPCRCRGRQSMDKVLMGAPTPPHMTNAASSPSDIRNALPQN